MYINAAITVCRLFAQKKEEICVLRNNKERYFRPKESTCHGIKLFATVWRGSSGERGGSYKDRTVVVGLSKRGTRRSFVSDIETRFCLVTGRDRHRIVGPPFVTRPTARRLLMRGSILMLRLSRTGDRQVK